MAFLAFGSCLFRAFVSFYRIKTMSAYNMCVNKNLEKWAKTPLVPKEILSLDHKSHTFCAILKRVLEREGKKAKEMNGY